MKLSDLITDSQDATRLSHSKLWSNIAYATATVVFVLQAWKGTLATDVWWVYLGVLGTHSAASKLIGLKYGKPTEDTPK